MSVLVLRLHYPSIDGPLSVLRSLGAASQSASTPSPPVPCSERSNFQYDAEHERRAVGLHLLCVTSPDVMTVYRHTLEQNDVAVAKVSLVCVLLLPPSFP